MRIGAFRPDSFVDGKGPSLNGECIERIFEQVQTIRRQIMELLSQSDCNARSVSQSLRISEKEVYDHLTHIARSVASQKKRLVVTPSRCMDCGYTFADRRRFNKPGRCPRCKGEHLSEPSYRID